MAGTSSCRTTNFPDRESAHRTSRRARLSSQIDTRIEYCSECEAWHLRNNDRRVDELNQRLLVLTALGLRAKEISEDVGISEDQVKHRMRDLQRVFKAISRSNLIATAIWLRVIDLEPLMPQFAPPTALLNARTKGPDESASPAK